MFNIEVIETNKTSKLHVIMFNNNYNIFNQNQQ